MNEVSADLCRQRRHQIISIAAELGNWDTEAKKGGRQLVRRTEDELKREIMNHDLMLLRPLARFDDYSLLALRLLAGECWPAAVLIGIGLLFFTHGAGRFSLDSRLECNHVGRSAN